MKAPTATLKDGKTNRVQLIGCESVLMIEIGDGAFTRRSVSQTYWWALQSEEQVNWGKVNAAIIKRWSLHALEWIKNQAWSGRCWNTKDARG